jgi:threonine dehydratase
MVELPTFADVEAARDFVGAHLAPTPLVHCWQLSQLLGCQYYAKCENLQPVGAFKVRGGVNLIGRLDAAERERGVISASTGNHGQSLAFAGQLFGVPVVIYGPEHNSNPVKVAAMRALGAEVRLFGRDFDEAREEVERVGRGEGYRYVHSANEPLLVAGVGTMGLEIFDALPDVDAVIVPVGGGSGACGNALVARHINPDVEIIGVQTEEAPVCYRAWKERRIDVEAPMTTRHEGLATRVAFEMPTRMMWELVDRFELVTDAAVDAAVGLLAREAKLVAEGAGAAALAAALKIKDHLQGKKVVGILSGGNVPGEELVDVLQQAG